MCKVLRASVRACVRFSLSLSLTHTLTLSAFKGENLVKITDASLASWYRGPTLVEAIDLLRPPVRPKVEE